MQVKSKKAFTLIELLVVVLIIGILAAVALPQYNKAVLKSRMVQGVIYARYLHDMQEMYYLANGVYAASADDLGIDFTKECPANWTCSTDVHQAIMEYSPTLSITYNHDNDPALSADWKGVFYCWASQEDAKAVEACKMLGPEWQSDPNSARYRIN